MSKAAPKRRRRIEVGDIGTPRFGYRKLRVRVIEDRGCIGVGGRRLLRVQPIKSENGLDDAFEIPAEELIVSKRAAGQTHPAAPRSGFTRRRRTSSRR